MKNEISEKNQYYIPKERYLELKHFCRQYPNWTDELWNLCLTKGPQIEAGRRQTEYGDPVPEIVMKVDALDRKISMVTKAATDAAPDYWGYILASVTEGKSYTYLTMRDDLRCPRDTYYILIRKFYWLLDKARN